MSPVVAPGQVSSWASVQAAENQAQCRNFPGLKRQRWDFKEANVSLRTMKWREQFMGESLEVCRDRPWNLQMSTNELIHIIKLHRRRRWNNPWTQAQGIVHVPPTSLGIFIFRLHFKRYYLNSEAKLY